MTSCSVKDLSIIMNYNILESNKNKKPTYINIGKLLSKLDIRHMIMFLRNLKLDNGINLALLLREIYDNEENIISILRVMNSWEDNYDMVLEILLTYQVKQRVKKVNIFSNIFNKNDKIVLKLLNDIEINKENTENIFSEYVFVRKMKQKILLFPDISLIGNIKL